MPGTLSRTARIACIAAAVAAVFALWIVVGTVNSGLAFFFSLPIGLAAWWFGRRAALLVTLVCVVLYVIGDVLDPVPDFALALLIRLVFFLGVVWAVSWLADRLRTLEHTAEELETIRAALTPADLPELSGVDAGAAFVPSELGVSGDFYLLTNGPDGSAVAIVGDVVGHGPEAARLATFIRARFAAFAANTSDPAELLTMANAALAERPGSGNELVSAICVRLDPRQRTVCWARAGHPPPLRLPELVELPADGSTFLLGAEGKLELENTESSVAGSEGLVVYTDGATDVRQGREMLGLEGLRGVLAPLSGLAARTMVGEVERAILAWADRPIRDDLCLVILKPESG
ncbi:MAG TPA: PP2C family protein-serine/threonine phosphatase [Solirubrobacterales bacterium]|nr:PP2C family protein-serine/threonine phosphatase [Solirubrobacterales bacterium]